MHLNFSLLDYNGHTHPQQVMHDLGITYLYSTPQSLGDRWLFWNCENVPDQLPPYLTKMDIQPHDAIGHGLSEEDADRIARGLRPSEKELDEFDKEFDDVLRISPMCRIRCNSITISHLGVVPDLIAEPKE